VGDRPLHFALKQLDLACRVTYALGVLALPEKTTSALPKDISPLGATLGDMHGSRHLASPARSDCETDSPPIEIPIATPHPPRQRLPSNGPIKTAPTESRAHPRIVAGAALIGSYRLSVLMHPTGAEHLLREFEVVGEVQDAPLVFCRYSLGARPNTRLNALLKAASES
jgi:hypothetical protein